ncbi:MAG: hypothetical protein ACLFV7_02810 [Phycisphaerae bacterium]
MPADLVLIALLLLVLVAAVVSFVAMGLLQARRAQALARAAYDLQLRFSHSDPFDLPLRYRALALIRSGHSPRASNVIYGRLKGRQVRCFDFRYEAGHGPRRVSRNYRVVVTETAGELDPVIMWNDRDRDWTPLEAQPSAGRLGDWSFKGSAEAVQTLGEVCHEVSELGVNVQCAGRVLMLCVPLEGRSPAGVMLIEPALAAADRLEPAVAENPTETAPDKGEASTDRADE